MTVQPWRRFNATDADVDAGFMPWEREIYAQWTRPGDRVLIVGSGTGRDLLPFVASGHEVVGIEPSPEPVAQLRSVLQNRRQAATIIEAFIEDAVLPGQFDLVIFSFLCYSYLRERSRRVAVLTRVLEHLNPGGRVVINYLARDPSRRNRAIRLAQWMARVTGSDWTPEEHDVLKTERNDAGERVLSFEHWFTPEEIEAEATDAGLRAISREGPVGVPVLVAGR